MCRPVGLRPGDDGFDYATYAPPWGECETDVCGNTVGDAVYGNSCFPDAETMWIYWSILMAVTI